MSQPEPAHQPEAGPVALSRLIDEIRADRGWRDEIAALRARDEGSPVPAAGDAPAEGLTAPPADPALAGGLGALEAAVEAADRVVPIEAGSPLVGEAWARLRRQIHGEIRIYQDRQTVVNQQVVAALGRLVEQLDPGASGSALGAVWAALARLEARVDRGDPAARRLQSDLVELRGAVAALAGEIEPLGGLRVAVAQLEQRLDEVERWRAES